MEGWQIKTNCYTVKAWILKKNHCLLCWALLWWVCVSIHSFTICRFTYILVLICHHVPRVDKLWGRFFLPMFGFQIWDLVVRFGSKSFYLLSHLTVCAFCFCFWHWISYSKDWPKTCNVSGWLWTSSYFLSTSELQHVPPCIVECLVLLLRLLRLVPLTAQNLWVS